MKSHRILAIGFSWYISLLLGCGNGADLFSHGGYCTGYVAPESSPYILPWSVALSAKVNQGNCSAISHRGFDRYAYDFGMSIGTPLVAVRDGEVMDAKDDIEDGTGCPQNSYIRIRHDDGTIANYLHITKGGALANKGDRVNQGDNIALSGNAGCSTGPHLHFSVFVDEDYLLTGTIPVTFSNLANGGRIIQVGDKVSPE